MSFLHSKTLNSFKFMSLKSIGNRMFVEKSNINFFSLYLLMNFFLVLKYDQLINYAW